MVDDANDSSGWFVVDVPSELAAMFEQANADLDRAVKAIHDHAGYDPAKQRLRGPCGEYVGRSVTINGRVFEDDCDACGWTREEHRG
ncbi:MAG: hypothetical protein AB7H43_14060 [Acidimicrobiia bacterium]